MIDWAAQTRVEGFELKNICWSGFKTTINMIEVKIKEYDEMTFIIPAEIEGDFMADIPKMPYLSFLEKWEKYKRNPDEIRLFTPNR